MHHCAALIRLFGFACAATPVFCHGGDQPSFLAAKKSGQFTFETYTIDSGLPQMNVVAALQTRDGYLWIGTQGGLARFDGIRFVSYRSIGTRIFHSHGIHTLFEDRAGNLWIGTEFGVVRYRNGKFEHIGLDELPITAIAEDPAGRIWFGTWNHGLYSWSHGRFERHEGEAGLAADTEISELFVASNGRLWIGTSRHVGLLYYERGHFQRFESPELARNDIHSFCESPRGTLWFGGSALFRLKDRTVTSYLAADGTRDSHINAVLPAQGGGLWVVTHRLLQVTDFDHVALTPVSSIPVEAVANATQDHEGSLWICAREGGLVRARHTAFGTITKKDGLPADGVRTVSQDAAGNLWLAVYHRGVVKIAPDGAVELFTEKDGFLSNNPVSAYAARDGSLWVGGSGKLGVWRDGHRTVIPETGSIAGIFEDRQGAMWIGTGNREVLRYADGQVATVPLDTEQRVRFASMFAEAPDGTIYVAARANGIYRLKDGAVLRYDRSNGLPTTEVRTVYVDHEGYVWVGLKGRGLAVLVDGRWRNPEALSSTFGDHVAAITEDDHDNLWLGTVSGIMWAPRATLLAVARGEKVDPVVRLASASDGTEVTPIWSGGQPNVWTTSDHKLLFATHRGVVVVDPDHLPSRAPAPPVHIEEITMDQQPVLSPSRLEVPAGVREIVIAYTATSFIQPGRMRFKYRLEGYEDTWTDAGTRRIASYANLPPGTYRFRVKACNSDGQWNERGDTVEIVQHPHFYHTWWFNASVLIGVAGLAFQWHRGKTVRLRRENERLEQKVAERTRDLERANAAKTEFLESVSHEIRNPLNGLNGLLGLLSKEPLGPTGRALSKSVQTCAEGLTRVFEEILGHAKLEHTAALIQNVPFSLERVLNEVAASFSWHAAQQRNELTVTLAADFVDGFEGDEDKLRTIVGNFVSNAIKYAPGSRVEISARSAGVEAGQESIYIDVRDHGPGVPEEEQAAIFQKFFRGANARQSETSGLGFGLASCRVLAAALGGSVGVESTPGEGAVFYLQVPLRRCPSALASPPLAAGGSRRVLIVDDAEYNRVALRGIALELGYEPDIAASADEARRLARAKRFDLIFLDWRLPDSSGGEVARFIREQSPFDQPVIIATTATDSATVRRECADAGMDEFLRKPYGLEQVREAIERARRQRDGADRSPVADHPVAEPMPRVGLFELYAKGSGTTAADASQRYASELDRELGKLLAAAERDALEPMLETAHRLCALGGLANARHLANLAAELEAVAPRQPPMRRRELVRLIADEIGSIKRQLEASAPTRQ